MIDLTLSDHLRSMAVELTQSQIWRWLDAYCQVLIQQAGGPFGNMRETCWTEFVKSPTYRQ